MKSDVESVGTAKTCSASSEQLEDEESDGGDEEEDEEDDGEDDGAAEHSAHQKRKCHLLKPPKPSMATIDYFLWSTSLTKNTFLDNGFTQMPILVAPMKKFQSSSGNAKLMHNDTTAQKFRQLERNKTKRFLSTFRPPPFANIRGVYAQPVIASMLRSHSNQTSYAFKRSPTESASQQTTRFQTGGVGSSTLAQQVAVEVTLALSKTFYMGSAALANPAATFESNASSIMQNSVPLALMTCSSVFFCASMPKSVNTSNMFDCVAKLATDELSHGVITSLYKPSTNHIAVTVKHIASRAEFSNWVSMAFVLFLYKEPRLRHLLEAYGVLESDVCVCFSIVEYGRGAVSNKSRRVGVPSEQEQSMLKLLLSSGAVGDISTVWQQSAVNVSLAPVEASLSDLSTAVSTQRTKALSKKCRRASSARFMGDADDSTFSMIEFVLCASAIRNAVMLHMVARSESDSARASEHILKWQIDQLVRSEASDAFIERLHTSAKDAARDSAANVVALCSQTVHESPLFVTWTSKGKPRIAIARSQQNFGIESESRVQSNTTQTMLACRPMPDAFKRNASTGDDVCVLWVVVTQHAKRSTLSRVPLTNVCECICDLEKARRESTSGGGGGAAAKRVAKLESELHMNAEPALPTIVTGHTLSVLLFKSTLVVSNSTLITAKEIGTQLSDYASSSASSASSASFTHERLKQFTTPATTPSNFIAVGLILQEAFRTAFCLSTQKRYPMTTVRLSIDTAKETNSFNSSSLDLSKHPNELLAVVDVNMRPDPSASPSPVCVGHGNVLCHKIKLITNLTVVGDSIVPVCSAIDALLRSKRGLSQRAMAKRIRSLVFAAATQVSTFGAYAASTAELESGTNIARTSKIVDPDNARCGFYTLRQAYVVGNAQVPRLFENTPWAAPYGSGYQTGSIAAPGRNASNVASDKRLTTVLYTDEQQIDKLTRTFAENLYVQNAKERTFSKIPYDLRGIPKKAFVGVHTLLNPLHDAFEDLKELAGTEDNDTVQSVQVLPISQWTENVPPLCCEPNWVPYRTGTSGLFHPWHSHRSDATLPECSVMNTHFLRAMRVRGTSEKDNLYETLDENMSSCFVIASAIAQLAKTISHMHRGTHPSDDTGYNMEMMCEIGTAFFFSTDNCEMPTSTVAGLFCDVCVLLTLLYPQTFAVGETMIPKFLERASKTCYSSKGATCASKVYNLTKHWLTGDADLKEVERFWSRVSGGAWDDLKAFVVAVDNDSGRFDLELEDYKRISLLNERFVRSSWYTHIAEGETTPCARFPTHGCTSSNDIRPGDALGVYVDRPEELRQNRKRQRGAIVGVKVGALQQILTCLQASAMRGEGTLNIRVQVSLNEGGMLRRVSSCALNANGRKAASPVGSENDYAAFGSFEAKKVQAERQQKAWLVNNEVVFEATRHISPPNPKFVEKLSGDLEGYIFRQTTMSSWAASVPPMVSHEQKQAENLMREAVLAGLAADGAAHPEWS